MEFVYFPDLHHRLTEIQTFLQMRIWIQHSISASLATDKQTNKQTTIEICNTFCIRTNKSNRAKMRVHGVIAGSIIAS